MFLCSADQIIYQISVSYELLTHVTFSSTVCVLLFTFNFWGFCCNCRIHLSYFTISLVTARYRESILFFKQFRPRLEVVGALWSGSKLFEHLDIFGMCKCSPKFRVCDEPKCNTVESRYLEVNGNKCFQVQITQCAN